MTEKQIRQLVAKWKPRLGLDDWYIAVLFEEDVKVDGRRALMSMHRSTYYKRGTVHVDRSSMQQWSLKDCIEGDLLADEQVSFEDFMEQAIVHELLHLAFRDMMQAGDLVTEDIHPSSRNVWAEAWNRAEESTVENLAIALVKSWPRP